MKEKLSILFTCLVMSIFSQEKIDITFSSAPMLEVLKKTETLYKVKFSFEASITKNTLFTFKKKACLLNELISEIETSTNLKFNQINDRYYFITTQEFIKNYNLLEEVQINNYVTSGIHKNKNGTVAILPQELGVLPGLTEPDVLESLKIIPGVQSPDETAAGIYIRGGTPDQNLIFWDGIKMYYTGHFFGTLSAFNPYTAKKITLSKSGTQARYGNKVSGVIDIKTDENIPEKITGGFGFNMTHADAYIKAPLFKKVAITSSFRRSFTDIINTFTFNKLSERVFQTFDANQERNIITDNVSFNRENNFYFADYASKIVFKPSDNESFAVSFLYTKNKLNNNFNIPLYKDNYIDKLDIKNKGLSFKWDKKLNDKLTHNFKSYYTKFNLNYYGNYSYIDNYLLQKSTKKNSVKDLGFSYLLDYQKNKKTNFIAGYEFLSNQTAYQLNYQIDIDNNNLLNSTQQDKGTNNTHSVFTEYLYNNNDWKINAGFRFNYFDKINTSVLEPRLYLEKSINDRWSFKTAIEKKHQALSQIVEFQSTSFDLEDQIWAQVNDSNTPLQKSFQISSGFIFTKDNWKIDIEQYIKRIKGMTSQTRGYNDQTSDFSRGKGEIFGIDVLINKKIGNYRTWINYSYTKNRFKFIDLENTFFPANHDITNHFSWSHAFKHKSFEFSLGWTHRTGNPYTAVADFVISPETNIPYIVLDTDNINAKRLPKYHRLDSSITYSFDFSTKWKGKLGFSILNIYNKKNILSRTFTPVPVINNNNEIIYELEQIDRVSLGATPNLVFRVSF